MDQALNILLLGMLAAISIDASMLLLMLLFTPFVTASKEEAETQHSRAFLTGTLNVLFFSVVLVLLLSLAERTGMAVFGVLAVLVGVIFAVGLAFGLTTMALVAGQRLLPDREPWRQNLWGGMLVVLASVTPYVGWFLLLPYLAARGFGAVVRTTMTELRRRRAGTREA